MGTVLFTLDNIKLNVYRIRQCSEELLHVTNISLYTVIYTVMLVIYLVHIFRA